MKNHYGPRRIIHLVDHSVVADADSPPLSSREFPAVCRTRILTKTQNGTSDSITILNGQRSNFPLSTREDEEGIVHLRERSICWMARSKGMGVSPELLAAS